MWGHPLKTPECIDLDLKQVDALLKRAKASLPADDYEIIKAMAETIYLLSQSVDQKATSIRRLLRMLFGATTEKLDKVARKNKKTSKKQPKKKGHGRKPAAAYTGAKKVNVPHAVLKIGDDCPGCLKGKLYEIKVPKQIVRITGNAPLAATVYQLQRLRCNLCGEIFTADSPEAVGEEKYDAASGAMIALLKYGSGLPFNRIEQLQASLGVPLAASTQWEIVEQVADQAYPVYLEFNQQAAQGDVIHNDDTTMKILELMKNNPKEPSERTGMFTTGILSIINDRKIALFYTGRKHAGENMAELLAQRQTDRGPPIQMCDALSRNTSESFQKILANCLAHGRRKFVDVIVNFPDQCRYVLETLAEVYKNDKIAKTQNMTPDQRLRLHQTQSGPLMTSWIKKKRSRTQD